MSYKTYWSKAFLRKLFVILVALHFATPLFAQFDFLVMTGSGAAMGGVSVAMPDEQSAVTGIAGLATIEKRMVALSVRQGFGIEGMGYAGSDISWPLSFGGVGASLLHYGNSDYNEQRITMAYALPMGESVSFGVAFHYLHSGTSDSYYDPLNRFTFSAALRYAPDEQLQVAFRAYNPVAVIGENDRSVRVPALFNMGFSYQLLDGLLTVAEVEKNLYYPTSLRIGLQYRLMELYAFRLGVSTHPIVYTFGCGIEMEHLGLDMAFQMHNTLGMTSLLAMHYSF